MTRSKVYYISGYSILLGALLLLSPTSVLALTRLYVDVTNGNDSNDGRTTTTAWKHIQKACDSAQAGTTVYIRGGTYHENLTIKAVGTAINPILFSNYNSEIVVLDGTGTTGTTMLHIIDASYAYFHGITIQNLTVNNAQGVLVESSAAGISTGLGFNNITIKNINWTNNAATIPTANDNAQGFIAYGRAGGISNITIDSCVVSNCILGFSEAMTLDGNINGFSIRNSILHDNTNIGIDIAGNYHVSSNPSTDHARNGTIADNSCYRNISHYATAGGIYVDGGMAVVIERNKCYENGWGIEIGCEENGTTDSVIVRDNLIYNNLQAGMSIGGYTKTTTGQVLHSLIRNNTFFRNNSTQDGTGEIAITKASNCTFINNVFYTNSQNVLLSADTISPQSNNVLNYNCWYSPVGDSANITVNWRGNSYTTFSDYRSNTLQEANSIYANPLFVSASLPTLNLHLTASSLCIDRSNPATQPSIGELDYDKNIRKTGAAIDMGAYEYGSHASIVDFPVEQHINIFPNPTADALHVQSDIKYNYLLIYDICGTIVKESTSDETTISVRALAPGIYFIKIFAQDSYSVLKFIKSDIQTTF